MAIRDWHWGQLMVFWVWVILTIVAFTGLVDFVGNVRFPENESKLIAWQLDGGAGPRPADYVREHPLYSLLVGGGLYAIIGGGLIVTWKWIGTRDRGA